MNIEIREYTDKDFSFLLPLVDQFEDYLISIDDMKRLRREKDFSSQYMTLVIEEVKQKNGKFYVAFEEEKLIGFSIGVFEEQSEQLTLEHGMKKVGRITELYLEPNYRGQGIGKKLMEAIETYFREADCDDIIIEVFYPNKNSLEFYKSLGYKERSVEILKELKN